MEDKQQSVNIRIIYNEDREDKDDIRKHSQEMLRTKDTNMQAWLLHLQICAQPMKVGRIFYSGTIFEMSPMIKTVLGTSLKKKVINIEASVVAKAAYETNIKRMRFYDKYNSTNLDHQEKLNLCKDITIYYKSRFATILAIYLARAFTKYPKPQYFTTRSEQQFVPAPGVLLCFNTTRTFQGFLTQTAKISNNTSSIVQVP
eukprot:4087779-Ditylum_brightwellii.AAC.1